MNQQDVNSALKDLQISFDHVNKAMSSQIKESMKNISKEDAIKLSDEIKKIDVKGKVKEFQEKMAEFNKYR